MRRQSTNRQVYPRVCGGTVSLVGDTIPVDGLSPRVRGNLRLAVGMAVMLRSIPACAGEPVPATAPSGKSPVYPRVCGGT